MVKVDCNSVLLQKLPGGVNTFSGTFYKFLKSVSHKLSNNI